MPLVALCAPAVEHAYLATPVIDYYRNRSGFGEIA